MMKDLNDGFRNSPNIQTDSELYELENIACDPENKIESFLAETCAWNDKIVMDIGCGTGFHLPSYAKKASHVFGVEPFDESRIKAYKRIVDQKLFNISIVKGTAEAIPLESNLVDFAYSRFAYFWGEGCEKGLAEVFRVLKPGGFFAMIDNNLERGTFGHWVKKSFNHSETKQTEIEQFWKDQGFKQKVIDSKWEFKSREDLENVLSIEFPKDLHQEIITQHTGLSIDYTFNIYYRFK